MKEQQRLRNVIKDKDLRIQRQETELRELKRLKAKAKAKDEFAMDTPSSEETSPKSSFSTKVPKVEIKARALNKKLEEAEAAVRVISINDSKNDSPPKLFPKAKSYDCPPKPPVPSRAGVNRKLNKPNQDEITPKARNKELDRSDSGRESGDATDGDGSFALNVSSRSDDGFSSSHEDAGKPQPPPRTTSMSSVDHHAAIRQLTNHRAVQKPSDIKHRSKLRSSTVPNPNSTGDLELSVADARKVVTSSGSVGDIATVTYWTEPYV